MLYVQKIKKYIMFLRIMFIINNDEQWVSTKGLLKNTQYLAENFSD